MALYPIKLPPGVYRNGTQYQSAGRWWDANLVRWYEGTMRPIGGWLKENRNAPLTGVCRGVFSWKTNDTTKWAMFGTNSNLYAFTGGVATDITPTGFIAGRVDSVYGLGYGISTYGTGNYGVQRPGVGLVLEAATWSIDNFGELPVMCAPHDGRILSWDITLTNDAVAVTNAPTNCLGVVVTPERFLVALGAGGDPRKVAWADQETMTTWTASATNQAGDFTLQTNGAISVAKRVRGGTLIWTNTDVHLMTYIGTPYVYSFDRVGSFCGAAGPNAVAALDSNAIWMGTNGFFTYDGYVKPLPCDVQDYIFSDMNFVQAAKIYAGANSAYGEVWWFYPSSNSTENDRYVIYNYRENHWSIGSLSRTAWTGGGIFQWPLATDANGYVYDHENGWTADGTPIMSTRYAQSGPIEIGNGDNVIVAQQLLPDEKTQGQTTITFKTKFTPEGTEQSFGPYSLAPYTPVRFTGRQVSMEVNGNADADWRIGNVRVDGVSGGKR